MIKEGDIVKWCWSELHQSTYTVLNINSDKTADIKQNFSIGTVLKKIPIKELVKINEKI
jgi:hypothetical protein